MNQERRGTQDRLVEAAIQLFSAQGFSATSTREIARLADVNETSLFRHFSSKQDLFWAALDSCFQRVRVRKELRSSLEASAPPELAFPLIFEFFVQVLTYQPGFVRLLFVGLVELRQGSEEMYRRHMAPVIQSIQAYVLACTESGTLPRIDPWIATALMAVTALADQRLYALASGFARPYSNSKQAAEIYSEFWLTLVGRMKDEKIRPHKRSSRTIGKSLGVRSLATPALHD